MVKTSEAASAANNADAGVLVGIAYDRLRNNFYGYLLTSLILFNLENIILLIKSNNEIEMTLIYIGLQKDFVCRFFWGPIIFGAIASILMPVVTASYALATGVIQAARDDSTALGSIFWANIKLRAHSYREKEETKRDKLTKEINELNNYRIGQIEKIEWVKSQRDEIERYIVELVNVYSFYDSNNSERNLAGLLSEIDKADLAKHFPDTQQLKKLIKFVRDSKSNISDSGS